MRPTIAEIARDALLGNYRALQASVRAHAGPRALVLPVIKANAYGHGLALCGRVLSDAGAPWLGVTCAAEALDLLTSLHSGLDSGLPSTLPGDAPGVRLLVMSGFFPGEQGLVLRHRLTPQVWESHHLRLLHVAAVDAGLPGGSVPVHVELDTGMSRQGVRPGAALQALLEALPAQSPIFFEGVLTHFSSAEALAPDLGPGAVLLAQVADFGEGLAALAAAGHRPSYVHAGNSANALSGAALATLGALADRYGATLLVRPGLALYGISPWGLAEAISQMPALQPVLRWRTAIASLRELGTGDTVGYNETFTAPRPMRVALLPVGYADGYPRLLSNRGSVLVDGVRAPVLGRISMDQTVVDVTGIRSAGLGSEVVLLGSQGSASLPAWELARMCGTIPYELLCNIAPRVPRVAV